MHDETDSIATLKGNELLPLALFYLDVHIYAILFCFLFTKIKYLTTLCYDKKKVNLKEKNKIPVETLWQICADKRQGTESEGWDQEHVWFWKISKIQWPCLVYLYVFFHHSHFLSFYFYRSSLDASLASLYCCTELSWEQYSLLDNCIIDREKWLLYTFILYIEV